jgi:hypothetical protein
MRIAPRLDLFPSEGNPSKITTITFAFSISVVAGFMGVIANRGTTLLAGIPAASRKATEPFADCRHLHFTVEF